MVNETKMIGIFASVIRDEDGAAMVEYGLLVALIALVAITGVTVLGTSLSALFNNAAGSIWNVQTQRQSRADHTAHRAALLPIDGLRRSGDRYGLCELSTEWMQTAADNAALAGAQALIGPGCPNQAAANTAAQNNAATNGFGASGQINVTVDIPPKLTDGPYKNVNCAVSVMVNVQKNATWFLNFVGYAGMPITAQAVALLEQNNPGCIFLLTPGASSNFNDSTTTAPKLCHPYERHG